MGWADGFIAVDWGTTNRRAYRIGADGTLADEMEDDRGILAVGRDGFANEIGRIQARMGDLPLLLAGMVGSNRGWVEAPYVPCPAGIDDLAARLHWVEPGRIAIVPGLSYRSGETADVMRGEEVQLLGAVAEGSVGRNAVICHPGTHNKWVRLENGRVTAFRTVMTGELFNLLKGQSILSDLLQQQAELDEAFVRGARHGLGSDDLQADLFSVRARVLLGAAPREEAASYISGLLIGSDVRIGLSFAGEGAAPIVMGRPELTRLYAAALGEAGRTGAEYDGERAFLSGAIKLAESLS